MINMRIYITAFFFLFMGYGGFAYDTGRAGFTIEIKGEMNPYKIFSIFLLPNEEAVLKSTGALEIMSNEVRIDHDGKGEWKIRAPFQPGPYTVDILDGNNNKMHLNILVLTPISEKNGEYLNGYRIGNYPMKPLNGNLIYARPRGFFEVTQENQEVQLTPHFKLKQFLCKQVSEFPKYLIIRERLLLKLEYLLEKVNENDIDINNFGFISGYRTPYYNKMIKNVAYSRHVYGGAADIFIDEDNDGFMDDLNKDGLINEADVRIFYNIVEEEFGKSAYVSFIGGLGFYKKNQVHKGFIHVDVRGWKARW